MIQRKKRSSAGYDPALGIDGRLQDGQPILFDKDAAQQRLGDLRDRFLFEQPGGEALK